MEVTEELIEVKGASLWTIRTGDGPPLMLSNGGPGCSDYLGPVAAMLEDNHQVIRWEQRGCGRSTGDAPYLFKDCLTDLEAIREHFGFETWIMAGHSWGADLSLAYALTYPQYVTSWIGISGKGLHQDRDWSRIYREGRDGRGEVQPDMPFPPNMQVNEDIQVGWTEFIHRPDLHRALAELDIPALIVAGSEDIRPSWAIEQIAELMPQGQFKRIEGAEHVVWHTHAEELAEILSDFIGGTAA